MSAPAQKARPAPVTITARMESSSLMRPKMSSMSRDIGGLKALSLSGRFKVMVSTPSSISVSRVS